MLSVSAPNDMLRNHEHRPGNKCHQQHDENEETPTWKAPIRDNIVYSPYPERDVPRVPIYTAVRDALRKLGSQETMVHDDRIITAAQLLDKMEAYATAIQAHGVRAGERIWCKLVNGIESFAALYGAIFAGAVAVLIDDDLTKHEAYRLSKDDMADYFLTDGTYAEKFKDSRQNFQKCFVVGGDFPGFHSLTNSEATCGETLKHDHRTGTVEEWPAALCFSSGTTGAPKAILITHYTFVASLTSSMSSHLLQRGDRFAIVESMTHAFGFLCTMYAACAGATIIITPPPMDNDFFDKIDEYQVQVVCCFPAMLTRISLVLEETGRQMASVKKVLCTAASIPRKVGERILRHLNLTDFKNCLGCSEGLSPYCVPPPGETAFECVGFPSSNVRIKVADPDSGRALGPGEHGEIWVQTPSATPGYVLHDGQLQRVVDDNGWLHTGDIGYYNQDGRFFVVERLKSIIKCRDYRVFPHELEAILNTHPAVIEACVVGIPDDEVTEAPTAFVVRSKNDHGEPFVTEKELVDLVASQTAYYKHLYGGVVFLEKLPRTANGKTNVKELRRWKTSTQHVETCKSHDSSHK